MMYIHYCQKCRRTYMLNGHRTHCPNCDFSLKELPISYIEYTALDLNARKKLLDKLTF